MKNYEAPILTVSEIDAADVIAVSVGDSPIIEWVW